MFQTIAVAVAAAFVGTAAAQQAARPDAADPKAAVPALRHDSAFKDYRPYREPEIARWREVNEELARLGGHAGHLPQSARPEKPAAQPPAHSGHGAHK